MYLYSKKDKDAKKFSDSANEISDPILLEQFVAIADYKKQKTAECSLTSGQIVEVIDKNENGLFTYVYVMYVCILCRHEAKYIYK